jgi:polysaccharide export outer membrane protein
MNNLFSRLSLARLSAAFALAFALLCLVMPPLANAQDRQDYALAAGDSIRIQVFQNGDLSIETRVSENGSITFPLVGAVEVGGLSIANAEKKIAAALQSGGFLQNPQVNITVVQMRGNQVSVLGQVGRPGRFALETANTRLSDMLANAGGLAPGGDDIAIVTGVRNGKPLRRSVDIPAIFLDDQSSNDIVLQGGDVVYVHRAPTVYVYGEVQRPGSFRLERDMTVMQALAQGGGPTARGNDSRLRLHRKNTKGQVEELKPQLTDLVQGNDVIFVKENIF